MWSMGPPPPGSPPSCFVLWLVSLTTASIVPEGTGPSSPDDMVVTCGDDVVTGGDGWLGSNEASSSPVGVTVALAKAPSRPEPSTVRPRDEASVFSRSAAASTAGLLRVFVPCETTSRSPPLRVHPTAEEPSRLRPTGVSQKLLGVGGGFSLVLLNAVEGELAFELNTGGMNRWRASSSPGDFSPRVPFSIDSGEVALPNSVGVEDSTPSADGGVARIPRRMWNRSCCDACR